MKTRKTFKPALIILLVLMPTLLWAQGTIELTSRAEMEIVKTNEQGEEITVRVPAEKVIPGEIIIYTNIFRNTGDEPASNIVIDNPVPEHTDYLPGSAFGAATILFSVDGGATFAEADEIMITGEDGRPRPAMPEEYTNLRWIINKELPPGERGEVGFRVRLQ